MAGNLLALAFCTIPSLLFSIEVGKWSLLITWPYDFVWKDKHHIAKLYERKRKLL